MARIGVGEAIGAGFGLIARRPITVLAWGLARLVFAAVVFAALSPFYLTLIGQFARIAANGGAFQPQDLAALQAMQGTNVLISIVGLFFACVLYCAVFRSVLFPERGAWAYLRIGRAELFYFLFLVGIFISVFFGMLVVLVPLILVAAIAAMAHAPAITAFLIVAGYIGIIVLLVWALCRVSVVGPMMVEDGAFHLFDAWALTRGHFWSLFLIWLSVVAILLVVEVVLGGLALAVGYGWLAQAVGGVANLRAFFLRPPTEILATLAPALMVGAVLSAPVSGCVIAIMAAPWARAYRDLRPPTGVAEAGV